MCFLQNVLGVGQWERVSFLNTYRDIVLENTIQTVLSLFWKQHNKNKQNKKVTQSRKYLGIGIKIAEWLNNLLYICEAMEH